MFKTVLLYIYLLLVLLAPVLLTSSCNGSEAINNRTKEGEIEFKINYLDNERKNPLILLLPKKMITQFKNNSTYSTIEGFMFKLNYITNYEKGKNATLFKIVDKKYIYLTDTSATPFGYDCNNKVKINHTEKEKTIAGLKCNHATAIFPNSKDTVDLYYTTELNIKNPNSNNPYKAINGVLLEFSVKIIGINMQFIAENVRKKDIDSQLFELPTEYMRVSKQEMENIINEYNIVAGK